MALLTPQAATPAGPVTTYSAAGASDTLIPVDRGLLLYRTTGTGSTLTIVVPGNLDYGTAYPDPTVVLGATDNRMIPTSWMAKYADPITQLITITSSSQATLVVAYVTN